MGLPTEILRFFNISNAISINNKTQPSSIGNFLTKYKPNDAMEIWRICHKLCNEGHLIHCGTLSNGPIVGDCYYNFFFDERMAEYGCYDFIAYGFTAIRTHFIDAIKPIIVKKKTGDSDIGTGFYIGDNLIVTARHCVENMKEIKIPTKNAQYAHAEHIWFPKDPREDIALIQLKHNSFINIPALRFSMGNVLDQVLTMGYPPISGFDAIQFAEIAAINSYLKSSIGNIVGKDKSYLDTQDYFLINAKVKGGNSGSPIINTEGRVVGILVNIPLDPENSNKLDVLGYGIAIPTSKILDFIKQIKDNNESISKIQSTNLEVGFSTL